MALTKVIKNWRVIMLAVFLIIALIAIMPAPFNDGAVIRSVTYNSSATEAGIIGPKPTTAPVQLEKIIQVDAVEVKSVADYYNALENIEPNQTIRIVTNKASYVLRVRARYNITLLNETEKVLDNTTNTTKTIQKTKAELIGAEDIGIKVAEAPKSNIRKGLDLAGGSRVLLKPEGVISSEDLNSVIQSLTQRLNVYGLSDVIVRDATDLEGNKFVLVEIAGLTEEEVKGIIVSQGKFEAKIGNNTVFIGGKKDITHVCRTADCSGIDPRNPCRQASEGWACGFMFTITTSSEAAQKFAEATKNLNILNDANGRYLSSTIDMFLDDKQVDSLQIAATLKGRPETQVSISGSGTGRTQQEAALNTLQNMKRLQTVIITGSLPVKLQIEKMDTLSPLLGEKFMNNIILVGMIAFIVVAVLITLRYKNIKVAIPMIFSLLSEVILILGFAAIVRWNLDSAAMAGIIITIGTGVDHLIVIADETIMGEIISDWKKRIKNAMFIVVGAYLTVVAGMLPLWFAGAGLLKGFAFTTIMGVSFGVLIARPAYAAVLKELLENK